MRSESRSSPDEASLGGCENGAALVEAALVLPILLLVVFMLVEVSLYFWTVSRAEKAVQSGVRRAVVSVPVALGPGLDRVGGDAWWDGLPPGLRCFPRSESVSPCPAFAVTCDRTEGCRCSGARCQFRFDESRLTPILRAMQAVLPELKPENVRIAYATNGFGYVGRPLPVTVDVTVSLIGVSYTASLLGDVFGRALPIRAEARRPSEDLGTP